MKFKKWMISSIFFCFSFISAIEVDAAMFTTIGDSISTGWIPNGTYTTPYGQYAADYLGMTFHQSAQSSNMFQKGYKKHPDRYFEKLIETHQSFLKQADVILVCEGTNDYNRDTPLETVKENMIKGLQMIKSYNDDALIIGVLPPNRWLPQKDNAPGLTTYNNQGYTLQDLRVTEQQIYSEFNIPSITFTQIGYDYTKSKTDDGLHLKPEEHRNLGKIVAQYIGKQSPHDNYDYYIRVTNDAALYDNLGFTHQSGIAKKGTIYTATKVYHHLNGSDYLSLYKNDQWVGYIKQEFTKSTNIQTLKKTKIKKQQSTSNISIKQLKQLTNYSGF